MEQENFVQPAPNSQINNMFTTVTPLSKYLAMILFILMPFVGGWVGYHYAPVKVVEVEKTAPQVPDKAGSVAIDDRAYSSVLTEVAGGAQSIIYTPNFNPLTEILNVFKTNQYDVQKTAQSPQEFILNLHKMVLAEDFKGVAATIPAQGLLTSDSLGNEKISGRSVLSGGVIWSRESIGNLVTHSVFENVKEKYGVSIEHKTSPIRNRIINNEQQATRTDASVNDVTCTVLNDEVVREDIMTAAIVQEGATFLKRVEGAEFAKTIYECGSGWGGHGNKIYIQPTKDGSSYQLLAVHDIWWE